MREEIDTRKLIALEEELMNARRESGIAAPLPLWVRIGDAIVDYREKKRAVIKRRSYILLALCCGWFSGAHRFYSGHYISGILYLLLCWTGIPFIMTAIDIMIALPIKADDEGKIRI